MTRNFRTLLLLGLTIGIISYYKRGEKLEKPESKMKNDIESLIRILQLDANLHDDIFPTVNNEEIGLFEENLGVTLPKSYRTFLNTFGNGVGGLYHLDQTLQGIGNEKYVPIEWANKFYNHFPKEFQTDSFGVVKTDSLILLMADSSNGGKWCWIVDKSIKDNEWALAYLINGKLNYTVENFTEWIRIATTCKGEVIRELDKEYKLGLG